MGLFIPGRDTRTWTFPTSCVVEKERTGGGGFETEVLGWLCCGFGRETLGWLACGPRRGGGGPALVAGSSRVSWRSWDHLEFDGSCGGPLVLLDRFGGGRVKHTLLAGMGPPAPPGLFHGLCHRA